MCCCAESLQTRTFGADSQCKLLFHTTKKPLQLDPSAHACSASRLVTEPRAAGEKLKPLGANKETIKALLTESIAALCRDRLQVCVRVCARVRVCVREREKRERF